MLLRAFGTTILFWLAATFAHHNGSAQAIATAQTENVGAVVEAHVFALAYTTRKDSAADAACGECETRGIDEARVEGMEAAVVRSVLLFFFPVLIS